MFKTQQPEIAFFDQFVRVAARGKINAASELVGASAYGSIVDSNFPRSGSGRDKLGFVLRQVMVQSGQAWRSVEFSLREQFLEVSARSSVADAVFDPEGRDRMIHCGMALQHLKLILKRHGCFGRVELFPDLDLPNLAARVHLGCGAARNDLEHQLSKAPEAEEKWQRSGAPSSDALLDCLGRAASNERSWLEFARCEESRQRLMKLVCSSAGIRVTKIHIRNETATGLMNGRSRLFRITGGMLHQHFARWRKPEVAIKTRENLASASETLASNPFLPPEGVYAVVKTKTDDRQGWLAAGQTLGGLQLHAGTLGVPWVPFPNVLRQPELRAELRTAVGHKGFMQLIICFNAPKAAWLAGAKGLSSSASMASRAA